MANHENRAIYKIRGHLVCLNQEFLRKPWLAIIVLVLIELLVYLPVFKLDFQTRWDDQWVAKNLYTEHGLHMDTFRAILTEFYKGQYAPLNQLYYTSLYNFFGYDPLAFHAAGFVLHALNSLLVFLFIDKLLKFKAFDFVPSTAPVAFLSSLLFAVNP
ncbi:hypothetical protein, partial [Noviherbaspirillum sp. ST9]